MFMTAELTDRARQLLDQLRQRGTWASRAELAILSGKHRLSPHDLYLLQIMIGDGLLETREVPARGPKKVQVEYRAKP